VTAARRDLLLFAGALAVRLAHLAAVRPGPLFRYLLIDSAFYDEVGRGLAAGAGFPPGVFFMNVLYGAFLGGVYAAFGSGDGGRIAALAIQAVLGAGAVVLTARAGDRLGRPREGLVAAAVLAAYGPAVFYDGALLTPSLLLFLTTAAVVAAVPAVAGCGRAAAVLGALIGLMTLGRANNALLAAAFAVLALRRGRAGIVPAAAMVAVAAAVVAPVTVRNWRASGELVPVTANGGMALWAGNHEGATGIYSEPAFLSNPVPASEAEDYRAEASRRAGRELTLAESGRFWTAETMRRWTSEPGAAARLFARKARLWIAATESQTNLSYYFAMEHSPVLAVLRIHLGWILPFALIGMVGARGLLVPAVPVVVSALTCLLFYVSSEYRHPVVPCLLLFAASGGFRIARLLRSGAPAWKRTGAALALVALFVAVNHRDPLLRRLESRRVDHYNFGALALDAGRPGEAEEFLRRSIAIDPQWPVSRRRLADALSRLGRVREASEQALIAERLEGGAPEETEARMLEANRRFQGRDYEGARRLFLEMAEAGGEGAPGALNNAGLCAMNLGEAARAESLFRAAAAIAPGYASPVVHLGRLALSLGDSASAQARALEALGIAPRDERAARLLARARGEEPAE
jgi:Tfp pilus assembly protein PilF